MASATYVGGEVPGTRIQFTAGTAAISAGDVVVVRAGATGMIGVAVTDIAAAGTGTVAVTGRWAINKATTTSTFGVGVAGGIAYLDVAADEINTQASANVKAGIFASAAAVADTTAEVLLIPSKA